MRMRLIMALMLGLALPAQAIAGPRISTDTAPGVNFSAYKTYAWVDTPIPPGLNPIIIQRIRNGIEAGLAQKGYVRGEPGDLSLIMTIGTRDKVDVQSWGGWGPGWGLGFGGWGGGHVSVYEYTQGQLSLDVFDTRSRQAVWHGQATDTVNTEKPKPEKIDKAVMKLMAQFPPTARCRAAAAAAARRAAARWAVIFDSRKEAMHRLFVAIRPPEAIRDLLVDAMDDSPELRWVGDEQLHLTLRFIGEVERPVADDLAAALAPLRFERFDLRINGVGRFDQKRGGALWAGVEPKAPVAALAAKVERACQSVGIEPERRAFHPHITLARWKGRTSRAADAFIERTAGLASDPFRVDELHPLRKPTCRATARIMKKWRNMR